ncbi:MAG: hypothetical protein J6B24_09500 [Clostridia bacterium]|nr:hypothetical protein [Clostridia bacterium]
MNAKRIFALVLSLLMVMASFTAVMSVSAEEDKFAPTNEEKSQMYTGDQGDALGAYGKGSSFGAMVALPEGKRLTQINFHSLATYNNNQNQIMFQVFQWDTDYATSVKGNVLAQVTIYNHADNAALDLKLPTNRNLTGELLWVATYVDGGSQMTPWTANGGPVGDALYFANGKECVPYMFSITYGDALTVEPATYTATFVAEGTEVGKVTFLEGDTELINIPAVPAKEGFWADWAPYTLANADLTIEAVYTDASGAIKPEINEDYKMDAFAEDHKIYLRGEGCGYNVNRDGTVSYTATWNVGDEIDAYATISYLQLMQKHYVNFSSRNKLPNKSEKYKVVVLKVKAPAICLDSDPNLTAIVGRDTEIYGKEIANQIKCDGTEEYWIFDFSDEPDFYSDVISSLKLNWAYSEGDESNLDAEFVLMGFQFYKTIEDAMSATGGEAATEEPTEEPTEAPETEAPTDAPATEAPTNQETEPAKGGCGSVIGFSAVAVLAAAAAAVALKKD